jgi:hypothetical protein
LSGFVGLRGIRGRLDRVVKDRLSIRLLNSSQRVGWLAAIADGTAPSSTSGSNPPHPAIRTEPAGAIVRSFLSAPPSPA